MFKRTSQTEQFSCYVTALLNSRVQWDGNMIRNNDRIRIMKETVVVYFNVVCRHSPVKHEGNKNKTLSGQLVTWPRFEIGTTTPLMLIKIIRYYFI